MATYHSTIFINSEDAATIRRYMQCEPESKYEAYIGGAIVYGAPYFNGYEMEVRCCGVCSYLPGDSNTAWGEAVLFDEHGDEVCYTPDVTDDIFGDWSLDGDDGNEYVAHVIELKED